MPDIVRIGDASDHGGSMVSATGYVRIDGVMTCVSGDMHSCPIKDHGTTPVSGSSNVKFGNKNVVVVGDVAVCGARIATGAPVDATNK